MFDEKSYSIKMDKAIDVFSKELSSLRTGRANASMLDLIKVDVYGQQMPINQVGSITTPEPRMINIQVWDSNNVTLVDAAIKKSDLGLNPSTSGDLIRLTMPALTEETRQEYIKQARNEAENSRISIRNTRRDANNAAKDQQKAGDFSEDDLKRIEGLVQKETDHFIGLIDAELKQKEQDLLEI